MKTFEMTFTVKGQDGLGKLYVEFELAEGGVVVCAARAKFGNRIAVGLQQVDDAFSETLLKFAQAEISKLEPIDEVL